MITAVTGLVLIGAIFVIVLVVARMLLRWAIKIAFVCAVALALTGGGLFGWWRGCFEMQTKNHTAPAATNKRAPANRATR